MNSANHEPVILTIVQDRKQGTISVFRKGDSEAIVTQNAKPDFRPYLHPIAAPDGKGQLTEYSPGHHKHQTGLYWGFTRVNGDSIPIDTVRKYFYQKDKYPAMKTSIGRDFFHHPEAEYWKRVSFDVIQTDSSEVSWQTVYDMLDEKGSPILQETQLWKMREEGGKIFS